MKLTKITPKIKKAVGTGILLTTLATGEVALNSCQNLNQLKPQADIYANIKIDIFDQHRFAPFNYTVNSSAEERIMGHKLFHEAADFMHGKIDAYQTQVNQDHQGDNFLKPLLDEIYAPDKDYFNMNCSIDLPIDKYNQGSAQCFAQVLSQLNETDRQTFMVCYDILALRSYNQSLGINCNSKVLRAIKDDLPRIKKEAAALSIDHNNYAEVERILYGLLVKVATTLKINPETLVTMVNMALYNEGMWGLHDYATHGFVNQSLDVAPTVKSRLIGGRTRETFHEYIEQFLQKLQTIAQNMTMEPTK